MFECAPKHLLCLMEMNEREGDEGGLMNLVWESFKWEEGFEGIMMGKISLQTPHF